ncbi:undecaprenyl-phosphate glucose phosphotransferase [Pontibacter sp. H249]|uniref:undecaprenyl-phosphate glucose phosphotransferase n=1 Tax=Pontibacter sp. H249 TaxID=3133420 RepID=UPI0030BC06A7
MAQRYSTLFRWINVVVDYLLLNVTLYFCFLVADIDLEWSNVYDQRLTILLLNFCWFFSSNTFSVYKQLLKRDAVPVMNATLAALCIFVAMTLLVKLALPLLYIPPVPFVYYFAMFPVLLLIWKFSFLLVRKYRRKYWIGSNNIVIIGASPVGLDFYYEINSNPQLDCRALGFFDDSPEHVPNMVDYLGKVEQCFEYAAANKVREVFCALPYSDCSRIEALMQEADKHMVRFRIVPDIKGSLHRKCLVELFGYVPVLKPRQEPLENKANEVVKRAFDVLFSALVVVVLLSWFVPLMALVIKLDSPGPVFFRQLRSGRNNRPFHCLKFRSMALNPDSDRLQATRADARVTRVGRFIRKTSIDELPQFLNVLLGDMSVVGPRPHMLQHTRDYSQLIDNYMVRHFLTPGITGWAQVNGFRGETRENSAMLNRVKADLWYLENWSVMLDFKIVFLTMWGMLRKHDDVY